MLLDDAVGMLRDEVTLLRSLVKQGDTNNVYWWLLQAKSLGLSHLQGLQASNVTDPLQADQVRKTYRKELQAVFAETTAEPAAAPDPAPGVIVAEPAAADPAGASAPDVGLAPKAPSDTAQP